MEQMLYTQVISDWTGVAASPRAHVCPSVCGQTNLEFSLNMELGIVLPVSQSDFYSLSLPQAHGSADEGSSTFPPPWEVICIDPSMI